MCKYCILHGKGKKWFIEVENFSRNMLDDYQRMELIDVALRYAAGKKPKITPFSLKLYASEAVLLTAMHVPFMKNAALSEANSLLEKYHFGQVLTLEETCQLVECAGHIVLFDCRCQRMEANKKIACCLGVGAFGDLAEDMPEVGAKRLTIDEAKEIIKLHDASGCFHSLWTFKVPFIGTICNCDSKVCHGIRDIKRGATQTLVKGHFYSYSNQSKCIMCGNCVKACIFSVRKYSREGRPEVDPRDCFGCGLCRNVCESGAIILKDKE